MNFYQLGQATEPTPAPTWADSTIQYFKPMIPWIVLSGMVSWFIGWKMGGVYCAGRMLKSRIGSSLSSAKSKMSSGISSRISSARAKVGLKYKRKK